MNGKQKITASTQWQWPHLQRQSERASVRARGRSLARSRAVPAKPRRKFLIYFAFHLVMDSVHMKYDVPWVFSLSARSALHCALCVSVAFHISMSMCSFIFAPRMVYMWLLLCLSFLCHLSLSIAAFFLGESKVFFSFWKSSSTRAHSHFLRSIQRTINDHFTLTYLLLNMIVVKRKLNVHTHSPRDR